MISSHIVVEGYAFKPQPFNQLPSFADRANHIKAQIPKKGEFSED
jgi:hypothetical protein